MSNGVKILFKIAMLLFGIIFFSFYFYKNIAFLLQKEDLKKNIREVRGTISNLEVIEGRQGKIIFHLNEYAGKQFILRDALYYSIKESLKVQKGISISLGIDARTADKQILEVYSFRISSVCHIDLDAGLFIIGRDAKIQLAILSSFLLAYLIMFIAVIKFGRLFE